MNHDVIVKIKKLDKTDMSEFIQLIKLFEGVFQMEDFLVPNQNHLQSLLNKNDFIVFVSILEDKVVGGLTTYVMEQYYSTKPLAYLFDLAVANHLQRKGIGKKLIAGANEYFKSEGFEELFVQADFMDDYAIDFYRATQPSNEQQVVHFSYSLNK